MKLRFGVVGTGAIAGAIADAIAKSANAELIAVSSRQLQTAQNFVSQRQGVAALRGLDALLDRADVDAVYIGTPTAPKEEIALAAISFGKHVLVDKPFANRRSVQRMTEAAAAKGVAFMDATHFVHHPRTAAVRAACAEKIGSPRSLHTTFYFPFSDRANIRFNVKLEPMGALGDLGWYPMRAVVEYLRPKGRITKIASVAERDSQTNAVVRSEGLIAFEGGEVSTFDVGYTAGAASMELQLLGTNGIITMDDFVLDWTNSYVFKNPGIKTGYSWWTGVATRKDVNFVHTPSQSPSEIAMIESFAELVASRNAIRQAEFVESTLKTQEYLDAIWIAAGS